MRVGGKERKVEWTGERMTDDTMTGWRERRKEKRERRRRRSENGCRDKEKSDWKRE